MKTLAKSILRRLPAPPVMPLVMALVRWRAAALAPKESLRFLFDLDSRLYALQGQKAVEYGGGVHIKHRLMRYHDFFVERIGEDEHVLDIGCGIGALAHGIATRTGARVTGIDHNARSIEIARARHAGPNLTYLVGDAFKDLPAERFDAVVLSNVLEHIHDRVPFLKAVQARIAPRRLLIRVPLYDREWRVPAREEVGAEWRLDDDHKTEYTVSSFHAELAEAGLTATSLDIRWGEIYAVVEAAG